MDAVVGERGGPMGGLLDAEFGEVGDGDRGWVRRRGSVSADSTWTRPPPRARASAAANAYARRILGWSVATTMTSQLVVDAVEQAVGRGTAKPET